MLALELLESNLQLIEPVISRFIDTRRLARRAHEKAGEQVRQRWMILPVDDQALQKIRAAQQRAVRGRGPPERDMIAAARTGMASVKHELLGAESRLACFLVENLGRGDKLAPGSSRMDVHFDDAGVGRYAQYVDPCIARR